MINFKKINRGYTLLEIIFYIALFTILSIAVINAMIAMTRAFKETAIQAELMQGGNILERISRETRQAYDITSISPSDLNLATKDDAGANKAVQFLLSGSDLELLENGTLAGNLNTSNISITAINFTQITIAKGKAVKIFLTVKSNHDSIGRSENFYDTVVLRGSY